MSEPVLTRKQKRKSLSSMKTKKKVVKNILATPYNLKLRFDKFLFVCKYKCDSDESDKQILSETDIAPLLTILESMLSEARLPSSKNNKKVTSQPTTNNKADECHARMKRSGLSIGINETSKGIKNESIACLIFTDDIQPQLLIMHLLLLCKLKKIAYIFVPNFRNFTKKALGFSCIVLGFKKNFEDFLPAIHFIKSLWLKSGNSLCEEEQNNEDVLIGKSSNNVCETEKKKIKKTPFKYLYTDSKKKRVFIPEENENKSKSNDQGFIPVENLCEQGNNECPENASISNIDVSTSDREKYKLKKMKLMKRKLQSDAKKDLHMDEELKHCSNISYYTSEIIKMESNPNREKKTKNLKKVFDS